MMRGDKTVSSVYGDRTCPYILGIEDGRVDVS